MGMARGELAMTVCHGCGFVFNAAFDAGKLSYSGAYDNNQAHSSSFQAYLDGLVEYLVDDAGVRGREIVDVGCGNGDFLRRLVRDPSLDNCGHGFDPAYRGPDSDCNGRARFIRSFYGPECASVQADVVVCRHVIEHVADPVALLRSVRRALDGAEAARVFFETPDVDWILRNRVIWDFFYEHCSLFSSSSLSVAFELAGFHVSAVRRVFGGQYLWLEATVDDNRTPGPRQPDTTAARAIEFTADDELMRLDWDRKLELLRQSGKVALWGAGAKGVTLANLMDPDRERIDCIVDLNPNKQGGFLPGTGHPIVDYRELSGRGVRSAILMNPNYMDENRRLLAGLDCAIELIE